MGKITELLKDKYKLRISPTVYYDLLYDVLELEEDQEPTTKNDLGVDCIDKTELLKAMDTWDKFGNDPNEGLIPLRTPALQDRYVPYVKYEDMVNCVKGMPSVTPQERKGYWIVDKERLGYWISTCSECEHIFHGNEVLIYKPKFCANCGAKMVEPQESEDKG